MSDNEFPIYSHKRRTGNKGVSFIKTFIENQFDWIFRPIHLEDDFGLDGYLDIIGVNDSVTGKYLGAQIKTGNSYFKSETPYGWVYNGENKHLNYYLNSNHPILIILVNLDLQTAFWVEFDINRTSRTKAGWSIIVPKENRLDNTSKKAFSDLAGDVKDYMSQIEYQWEMNDQIKKYDFVVLNISKEEVLEMDVSGFVKLLDRLTINPEMISKARGKILYTFDGYENDVREIYEIEEIREWVKLVIPVFKYWGYFLNMDEYMQKHSGLGILSICYLDIKAKEKGITQTSINVGLDKEQVLDFMNQIFDWLNEFSDKYGISEAINREQSALIAKILFGYVMKLD